MKKIGLIGGMSWESTAVYYELINKKVGEISGGFHSSKCILESVDFAEVQEFQHNNDWNSLNTIMADAAKRLEKCGAEVIILCTNTMHLCSESIIKEISVPFLHIADATGRQIVKQGIKKVALLGTKFTMEKEFYKGKLKEDFDLNVMVPDENDRNLIHDIIYTELVRGQLKAESKEVYKRIIKRMQNKGAQGVILGCTEIPLLIKQSDVDIPVFDTTKIHAESTVEFAMEI